MLSMQIPISLEPMEIRISDNRGCILFSDHKIRCWGANGQNLILGYGFTSSSKETVDAIKPGWPAIDLGTLDIPTSVRVSVNHQCALFKQTKLIKCWGNNLYGQLGSEIPNEIRGDSVDEMGDNFPFINIGKFLEVESIETGNDSITCAIIQEPNGVKCWGNNKSGYFGPNKGLWGFDPNTMGDQLPWIHLGEDTFQ